MEKKNSKQLFKSRLSWGTIFVILLITSATFYILKEKEKQLRIYTQERLTKTVEAKREVEGELAETVKAKETVQRELAVEKKKTTTLEEEVEVKEQQLQLTLEKLEKEMVKRREAEAELILAMREKMALETKLKEYQKAPKLVELEKIVIKPTPTLIGRVLVVNNEYAFVIIDIGKQNNLKLGDILSVYRDDKFIGRVQIESVEEDISAATILPEWQDRKFKEDDEVKML